MNGFVSGKVIESRNPDWSVGDLFGAALPFQTYVVVTAEQLKKNPMRKLNKYISESELSLGIGLLGIHIIIYIYMYTYMYTYKIYVHMYI